jgi:DNA-binding response OmpR family regulator
MEAKLLIVEDEERLRSSLQEYFEREGFSVAIVEDGARALAMLSQVDPDLIILDVQLPRMDGLEVCQTVRQRVGHSVGIIMISGIKKEMVDRVVGLEIGADVYMTKPFETRELLAQGGGSCVAPKPGMHVTRRPAGSWWTTTCASTLTDDRWKLAVGRST